MVQRHQKNSRRGCDGSLYDFVKTVSRRKLGRIMRGLQNPFQIADTPQRDRRGVETGGVGIAVGFFLSCDCADVG